MRFLFVFGMWFFAVSLSAVCHADLDMGGKSLKAIQSDPTDPTSLITTDVFDTYDSRLYKYAYLIRSGGLTTDAKSRYCYNLLDSDIVTYSTSKQDKTLLTTYYNSTLQNDVLARKSMGDGWVLATLGMLEDVTNQVYSNVVIDKSQFGKYKSTGTVRTGSSLSGSAFSSTTFYPAGVTLGYYKRSNKRLYVYLGMGFNGSGSTHYGHYAYSYQQTSNSGVAAGCVKYTNTKITIEGVEYPLD